MFTIQTFNCILIAKRSRSGINRCLHSPVYMADLQIEPGNEFTCMGHREVGWIRIGIDVLNLHGNQSGSDLDNQIIQRARVNGTHDDIIRSIVGFYLCVNALVLMSTTYAPNHPEACRITHNSNPFFACCLGQT